MADLTRPWRSVLYIPGSKDRALEKARGIECDAIIFDLEDAVAVTQKASARDTLCDALREGGYGAKGTMVRINGLDTEWGEADLRAVARLSPEAVLLPKVSRPEDVARLDDLLSRRDETKDTRIWAMMETPDAIPNAFDIARAPRMEGFVVGTNDLAAELRCRTGGDRAPMMMALQTFLAAARAGGIVCVDGVYNAFKDADGLRAECAQGRDLGMDGKSLIHPAQVAVANEVFSPTEAEIVLADRHIIAWEEAKSKGLGIAVVDGQIVENLHVARAKSILARARDEDKRRALKRAKADAEDAR